MKTAKSFVWRGVKWLTRLLVVLAALYLLVALSIVTWLSNLDRFYATLTCLALLFACIAYLRWIWPELSGADAAARVAAVTISVTVTEAAEGDDDAKVAAASAGSRVMRDAAAIISRDALAAAGAKVGQMGTGDKAAWL